MTKNCLSCAFCTRNQDTWISMPFKAELSNWRRVQQSLTAGEREALRKGDDSFIEREIKAAKLWDEQFAQEQEREEQRINQHPLGNIIRMQSSFSIMPPSYDEINDQANKYGMEPRPEAPDEDYLSCFHKQWNESKNTSTQTNRKIFLENKECSRYFPFEKMGSETLEACEENRKDAQESKRFKITIWLIVVGIVVTGFGIVATIWMGMLAIPAPGKIETAKPVLVAPASDKQAMPVKVPADSIKKSRTP